MKTAIVRYRTPDREYKDFKFKMGFEVPDDSTFESVKEIFDRHTIGQGWKPFIVHSVELMGE